MSGPPYPHQNPAPGSNAFGQFAFGVSPFGDIPSFDYWKTVISQFANSAVLTQMITDFFQYFDQTANIQSFFDLIWNIDSAQGYGLDVWGRIVGVTRVLEVADATFFGFAQQLPTVDTWGPGGSSPFYSGTPATSNFSLTDTAFRSLIFAKAFSNISDGSISSINQLLLTLFPNRGNCFVQDNNDMTMVYVFKFILTPVEAAIVGQTGILPKPVGVLATVTQGL